MQLFESVSRWFSDIPVVRRARTGNRVIVDSPVIVRVNGEDHVQSALMRDLSFGGTCIRCDLRLARGDVVWLRMEDDEDAFEFSARVVHVRQNDLGFFTDYGLRLIEISLPYARALSAFIARRTPPAAHPAIPASASRNAGA